MSIRINLDKCVGCNKCVNACPGSLIDLNKDKRAYIKYPKDCWGCTACIKECNFSAIDYFLGEDIGGKGSILRVENNKETINWIVEKPNGEVEKILIDKKRANSY